MNGLVVRLGSSLAAMLCLGAMLACTGASLWLTAAPALAAAPEAPETLRPEELGFEAEAATGGHARLRGILNPGKGGPPGTFTLLVYEFLYRASGSECQGGSRTVGLALGGGGEFVSQVITGLAAHTEYSVCLLARDGDETSVGPRVTFTTAEPPETGVASEITATSAKLSGVVNPGQSREPGYYYAQYMPSASKCYDPASNEARESEWRESTGGQAQTVTVSLENLLPSTTYSACIGISSPSEGKAVGMRRTFTTPAAAPTITEESVAAVGPGEATVAAEISPGALESSYRVEYGPESNYGASTAAFSLAGAKSSVSVRVHLAQLQAGTTYHFRFVAENELGAATGQPASFTTTPAGGATSQQLPDDRGYELVSPATSRETYLPNGEDLGEEDLESLRPYRAAANGDAVTFAAEPPGSGEGGSGSQGGGFGDEYLSTRGAQASGSGWETSDITPLARNIESHYEAFSDDLSVGIFRDLNPEGELPTLAEEAPGHCRVLYVHSTGGFASLFSQADVQRQGFCGYEREPISAGGNEGTASTPAFSRLVFGTAAALTPDTGEAPGEGEDNLYISSEGMVHAVNVVKGKSLPDAVFGGPAGENAGHSDYDGVISADGSRVFWSAVQREGSELRPTALYVREDPLAAAASTVQLDEAQAGAAGPSGKGQFWAASSDGSRVFFTDCNKLVAGSTADSAQGCYGPEEGPLSAGYGAPKLVGADLYEYDFAKPVGQRLTDLTIDHGDPEGADVQGVVAASTNGEYVYFVADGVLAGNANANHETAQAGEPNLYVIHQGTPSVFIGALAHYDDRIQGYGGALEPSGDWRPGLGVRTAQVTPDGESLVFESHRPLTGYDNAVAGAEEGEDEVFLYDAPKNRLTCVSCSPAGAPVTANVHASLGRGTYMQTSGSNTFMHRWVNEAGTRVFFDTAQPLVPQDTNRREDVYEWESAGEGSCSADAQHEGCVYLISGGGSSDQSVFVDASASGGDVFFATRGQMVAQDRDGRMDMYDARVGGGFEEAGVGCTGTGCQGLASPPPIFATPASVTFAGVGNFPPSAPTPALKPHPKAKPRVVRCSRGHIKRRGRRVKVRGKSGHAKRSAKGRK